MSNIVLPHQSVADFVRQRLITRVLHCIRSGKEASVWACAAHPCTGLDLVALKVYRPIAERSFRHDSIYREGRLSGQTRWDRAIAERSSFGLFIACACWVAEEFRALSTLHGHGASVPRALARTEDALLMAFVGDGRDPAPQLRQVDAPIADVGRLWRDVLRTMVIGLDGNRIHGDLSPYNILMCAGRAIVIDWPQSVDPRANPSAEMLLHRDVAATVPWFVRRGLAIDAGALAGRLWSDWLRSDLDLDRVLEEFGNGSDPD